MPRGTYGGERNRVLVRESVCSGPARGQQISLYGQTYLLINLFVDKLIFSREFIAEWEWPGPGPTFFVPACLSESAVTMPAAAADPPAGRPRVTAGSAAMAAYQRFIPKIWYQRFIPKILIRISVSCLKYG